MTTQTKYLPFAYKPSINKVLNIKHDYAEKTILVIGEIDDSYKLMSLAPKIINKNDDINIFGESKITQMLKIIRSYLPEINLIAIGIAHDDTRYFSTNLIKNLKFHWVINQFKELIVEVDEHLFDIYKSHQSVGGARAFNVVSGDFTNVISFAKKTNAYFTSCLDIGYSQTSIHESVAIYGSKIIKILIKNPMENTSTTLENISIGNRTRTMAENNQLLISGITPSHIKDNKFIIRNSILMYKPKEGDIYSYMPINIPEILDEIKRLSFAKYQKIENESSLERFLLEFYTEFLIKQKNWCKELLDYRKTIEINIDDSKNIIFRSYPIIKDNFMIPANRS